MSLRRSDDPLDTYLLRVFVLLISERSVSRTALRLNQSQPAVSAALKRLREILGDPLLVREKGGMVPTERALGRHHAALLPHQQRIAEDLAQTLQGRADCGLRLVQAQRGARHAALADQEHEHAQQVGVERVVTAPQAHGGSPRRSCVDPGRERLAASRQIRESIYHI